MNFYHLPDLDEANSSQIPALIQLVNMGYTYLSRNDVRTLRQHNLNQYILTDIAFKALRRLNNTTISDQSIYKALSDLEKPRLDDGVIKASEYIYTTLVAGCGVQEFINGKTQSPQLKFIDFEHSQNNAFHVAAEFEITEGSNRRPDIVVFVNGLPLAVIENKKPSVSVKEAVVQMLRNQQGSQVPKFFLYPQILIATNREDFKYGTMLTPASFYSEWKLRGTEAQVQEVRNSAFASQNHAVNTGTLATIGQDLLRSHFKQTEVPLNAQNTGLYALLEPSHLLDIVKNFIVYDNNIKKIARYQQYYAIKNTLSCVQTIQDGKRKGGLIWHTQGSGKSLTMVMLVKNLIEIIQHPRIIVVTDRTQLDEQIRDTFAACNIKKDVVQASSADHLKRLIKDKSPHVITTLIHKFAEMKKPLYVDKDQDIFILVDEAHRTQGGIGNQKMIQMLPNACILGFTGTPLLKKDKPTSIAQFGGLIDAYTISEAQADGAVLPLIYQGLFVEQQASEAMDMFFNQIVEPLTKEQKAQLAHKFVNSKIIEETSQRIEMIALDVRKHFIKNFQGTGLKAQAVLPSKYAAICFKEALDLLGGIKSAVIISDTPNAEDDDSLPEHKRAIAQFLDKQKHMFGSLERYEQTQINSFKKDPDGCELLIVVDKLLTGFDAPVNTALYLAKQLKDHNLLQAIARVNRIYEGRPGKQVKVNGFIFDYSKNAKNLKNALELFSNFDEKDVANALLNTDEKIADLEGLYQTLLDTFKTVKNKENYEEYIAFLKERQDLRKKFYEQVNSLINELNVCRMLPDFYAKFPQGRLDTITNDLKRFIEIKKIAQTVMAEKVDFSKYQDQIRKILDKYVTAQEVDLLSKPINLSDAIEFNSFIEDDKNGLSDRSKAEAIAAQTQKTISERWDQDPIFYDRFSRQVQALLADLHTARQEDLQALLDKTKDLQREVENYEDKDIPLPIQDRKEVHPYYRLLKKELKAHLGEEELIQIATHLVDIINKERKVDWKDSIEVKRTVRDQMEDYFFDEIKGKMQVSLTVEFIESFIENTWNLAIKND